MTRRSHFERVKYALLHLEGGSESSTSKYFSSSVKILLLLLIFFTNPFTKVKEIHIIDKEKG